MILNRGYLLWLKTSTRYVLLMAPLLFVSAFHVPNSFARDVRAACDNLDTLPPWDYEKMTKPLIDRIRDKFQGENIKIRVLTWFEMEEKDAHEPRIVDSALLLAIFTMKGQETWALADVLSHPRTGAGGWGFSYVRDSDWDPIRIFQRQPSNREIYEFLRFWHFVSPKGYLIKEGAVREKTWETYTGEKPTKFYALNEK